MKIPRILLISLSVLSSMLFWGCGSPEGESGVLTVYSAGPRPLAQQIVDAFEEEKGVRVRLFTATTGQVMARLEAERYRPQADVVILASRVAADALKEQGRLEAFAPANAADLNAGWADPDRKFWATSAVMVGVALREDAPPPVETWEAFFRGEWEGRIVMPSPSRSGTAADFVLSYIIAHGDDAWSLFRIARNRGLDMAGANNQAIAGLLMGAYEGILGAADYLIYRQIADGAALRMYYPAEGVALVTRPIVRLSSSREPDLAQEFIDFYFSFEMQEKVASFHLLPAHKEVSLSEVRAGEERPEILRVDPREALLRQRPILRRFQMEIERAAVVPEP